MVVHGESIFKIKPKDIKKRLETIPWVKKAEIIRKFPGTVVIDIEERVPVAMVSLDGKLFYIDDEGTVFKEASKKDNKDLPVAVGFSKKDGKAISSVIKHFNSIPQLRKLGISHMVKRGDDIALFTMGGVEFLLDGNNTEESIDSAGRIASYFEKKGFLPGLIDVRIKGRAVCRR